MLSEETRPLNHLFTLFSGFIRSSLRLCSITGLMAPLQMCRGVLCTYFRLWKVAEIPEGKYDFQNSQLALRRSLVFCFVVFLVYYLKLGHSNWMVTFLFHLKIQSPMACWNLRLACWRRVLCLFKHFCLVQKEQNLVKDALKTQTAFWFLCSVRKCYPTPTHSVTTLLWVSGFTCTLIMVKCVHINTHETWLYSYVRQSVSV